MCLLTRTRNCNRGTELGITFGIMRPNRWRNALEEVTSIVQNECRAVCAGPIGGLPQFMYNLPERLRQENQDSQKAI